MKRFLIRTFTLILIISFCTFLFSCDGESNKQDFWQEEENQTNSYVSKNEDPSDIPEQGGETETPIETVNGPFVFASDFHEGYAFVEKHSERGTVYCIDKTGKEIFKVENYMPDGVNQNPDAADLCFSNGYVSILGNLYDTSGRKITPESLGVTEFIRLYDRRNDGFFHASAAMPGGYILAKKTTSTYDTAKQELGILNSELEWTVPLSEEFHQRFMGAWDQRFTDFIGTHIYLGNENYYLDPATGIITDTKPSNLKDDSSSWERWTYSDETTKEIWYGSSREDIRLRITVNANVIHAAPFCNGKAPILLQNEITKEYFATIINESGAFLFDPIKLEMDSDSSLFGPEVYFDGSYLIIAEDYNAERSNPIKIFVLDATGKLVQETTSAIFHAQDLRNRDYFSITLGDGVIKLCSYDAGYYFNKDFCYITIDFESLY